MLSAKNKSMRVNRLGVSSVLRSNLQSAQSMLLHSGACGDSPFRQVLPAGANGAESLVFPPVAPKQADFLIEIVICLDRVEGNRYLYSKLYFATHAAQEFSESRVICFEVRHVTRAQRIQIALPAAVMLAVRQSRHLRLRLDGLPYSEGSWRVFDVRLVAPESSPALAAEARRRAHRQWVREQVLESETKQRVELPHYPESLSLELTPVCSLQCPHCSSHGRPHLHQHHNQLPEMSPAMLQRIGHEAFAHASVISLVGRGEPTRATDALWACLSDLVRQHDVRISCVSNGTRLDDRLDATLMPWIHEVTFSVDGATTRTFELNRRGARLAAVMKNIRRFHELRCSSQLARRPQLTISWTLKRNNVEELPAFVDMIIPCEPDLLSIRHMVIFQEEEKEQSLLGDRERANRLLCEAYEKLDRHGVRYEGPPLMLKPAAVRVARPDTPFVSVPEKTCAERERRCNWMHRTAIIMSDGEVTTCGKHYGAQVGQLSEQTSIWDIWNGPSMCSLRATFGREGMWHQCQHCWLREIKWHSQRQAKDAERVYAFSDGMDFTESAWDYRRYSEL